jgi:3-oxoacyl-[acyl-carrier protein] reductase
MEIGLRDWVVLITGASGGIGRATAARFAEEGAFVALHAFRNAGALESWRSAQPWAARSIVVEADVREPDALTRAFAEVRVRFGRVDVTIANAGIWPEDDVALHRMEPSRVRDVIEVNLLGTMWTARAFVSSLEQTGSRADGQGASLAFVGSTAGRFGEPFHAEYAASKAALRGLVLSLKNEIVRVDRAARVNMVEPGWTVTPMADTELADDDTLARIVQTRPLQQIARSDDVANALVWLSSPRASRHVSGEIVTVAGGMEGRLLRDRNEVDVAAVRASTKGE